MNYFFNIELQSAINTVANEIRRRGQALPGAPNASKLNRKQRRAAARRGR